MSERTRRFVLSCLSHVSRLGAPGTSRCPLQAGTSPTPHTHSARRTMRLVVATLLLAGQAAAYFDDGLAQSDSMTPLPVIDPETGKRVLGEWTKLRPRSRLRTLEDVATFAAASAARDGRFVIGFFKAADPELSETAVPDWEEDAAFQKFNAAADLTPGVQMGVVANVEVARALNVPRLPFTVLMSQVLTRPRIFGRLWSSSASAPLTLPRQSCARPASSRRRGPSWPTRSAGRPGGTLGPAWCRCRAPSPPNPAPQLRHGDREVVRPAVQEGRRATCPAGRRAVILL